MSRIDDLGKILDSYEIEGFRDFKLKSREQTISIPEQIFKETGSLFYLLTGDEKENSGGYHEHASPDAAMIVLKALNLSSRLVATNIMIGYTPIGRDVIWLAIARAKAAWKIDHEDASVPREDCENLITKLNEVLYELAPEAKKEYNSKCIVYARGGPIDLGIEIQK